MRRTAELRAGSGVGAAVRTGQVAIGGDIGVFLPADEQFDPAIIVGGGLVEVYAAPRVGIRGSVFATAPEYKRGDDEDERQIRLGLDVIYNWEGGKVHPFVGAGVGMHLLQFTDNGEDIGGPNDRNSASACSAAIEYLPESRLDGQRRGPVSMGRRPAAGQSRRTRPDDRTEAVFLTTEVRHPSRELARQGGAEAPPLQLPLEPTAWHPGRSVTACS